MFAAYPMVDEADASGRVAAVYAEMLDGMPMVPSLFKSLALCPPYLVMAWRQLADVQGTEGFSGAADRVVEAARAHDITPDVDLDAGQLLARFVGPLGRMTVAAAGLWLALDGELDGEPAGAHISRRGAAPAPELDVPAQGEIEDPSTFDRIRASLGTPIINSLWRHAAGEGLLTAAWRDLEPAAVGARRAAPGLRAFALEAAAAVDWQAIASPDALEDADCTDAAPGVAAILDGYLTTLPAVLALVAGTAE